MSIRTREVIHTYWMKLGIRTHERMDDSLKVRLIENATQMSYQKAVNQESQSGAGKYQG